MAVAAGDRCAAQPAAAGRPGLPPVAGDLEHESALVRRVKALLAAGNPAEGGGEWSKTDYTLAWPKGVDERDPDIARSDLPVHLSTILHDLDAIRAAGNAVGAELVLASFIWLVKDGMVLHPIRHRSILEYLNQSYAPFRYRDLERLAAFENRVFAKYARAHDLAFIDVARLMPFDPDLFIDAIHNSYAGERLRAWVFLQGLVPIVERHLKSGAWPRKVEAAKKPRRPSSRGPSPSPALANSLDDSRSFSGRGEMPARPTPDAPAHSTHLVDDQGAELPQAPRRPAITRPQLYELIAPPAQSIYWQTCPLTGSRRRQHSTSLSKARPELQK